MRAWVDPLGWMLVHSVWLISVIVSVAAIALSLLRRRSANARYLAGCIALMLSVSVLPGAFAWVLLNREVALDVATTETARGDQVESAPDLSAELNRPEVDDAAGHPADDSLVAGECYARAVSGTTRSCARSRTG